MTKNLLRIHPQSYPNLLLLKQLQPYSHPHHHPHTHTHTHSSEPHLNQCPIKQQILNFKHRLPLEIQKAILEYFQCWGLGGEGGVGVGTGTGTGGGFGVLAAAARAWRGLRVGFGDKVVGEFQELMGKVGEMGEEQADVFRYNLACLYQRNGHNVKAQKMLQQITHLPNQTQLLTLKLHLKSSSSNSHPTLPILTPTLTLLTHYNSLTQTPATKSSPSSSSYLSYLSYLSTLTKCQLYELYNIAIVLKKSRKFEKAIVLFEKVKEEVEKGQEMGDWGREGKIWGLVAVNLAECWYGNGEIQRGIDMLMYLVKLQNYYLQPYTNELSLKIQCWTKSKQILKLTLNLGQNYHSDALKLLNNSSYSSHKGKNGDNKNSKKEGDKNVNGNGNGSGSGSGNWDGNCNRNLLKNRKLCILGEMGLELEELASKGRKGKDIGLGMEEKCKSAAYELYSKNGRNVKSIQTARSKRTNPNPNPNPSSHKINHHNSQNLQIPTMPTFTSRKLSNISHQNPNPLNPPNSNPNSNSNPNPHHRQPAQKIPQNLTSLLTSKLQSSNVSCSNLAAFSSSQISSSSSTGQNQNEINHYWAAIKAARAQGCGDGDGQGRDKDRERERDREREQELAEKFMNLGDVYVKVNDLENAEAVYKKALERGRYEAYGRLGNIYYQKNKTTAIEYFQKHLKNFSQTDAKTTLKLLHCYSKCPEHHKKATQKLKQLLQQNPFNLEAHILLATVYVKQNHVDRAIQICEEFRKGRALCQGNLVFLGLVYKMVGRGKDAFRCFIDALRINPLNTASLIQLTQLTYLPDFYPQLITIYKKALSPYLQPPQSPQPNPNSPHSPSSSPSQHQLQKNHEIIQILKHLIEKTDIEFDSLKPKLVFSELIALGDFFLEKEMVEEAEYCYREAGEYTSNSLLKEKLGNLEYFKDNFAQAEKYYKQSQKRKPHLKIHLKLADSLIKQQKHQQAESLLQQYLTKQSQNKSTCLNMLGQCEFELGKYQQALERFKLSSQLGYNRRVNFTWEKACRRKIMEEMRNQAMVK